MNAAAFPFDDDDFVENEAEVLAVPETDAEADMTGVATAEPPAEEETTAKKGRDAKFTVTTRKTRQKYTFKNFESARQGTDIFLTSEGTLEEKSALFDEVAYEIEEINERLAQVEKEHGVITNGGTAVALVPIGMLAVDPEWGREKMVDWAHVGELVVNHRDGSFSLPTVTLRKIFDEKHRLLDVVISLTDGVHRTASLKERGGTHVRAICMIVENVTNEAQLYTDLNYNRRSHGRLDIIRGRNAAGDPELQAVVKFLDRFGLKFPTKSGRSCKWPAVSAVQTVLKSLRRYGEDTMTRVFELVTNPDNKEWYQQDESISGDMLAGLADYVHRFEKPGYIHSNMTEYLFKTVPPVAIANVAETLNQTACDEILHRTSTRKKGGGETTRQVQHTCALAMKIRDLFKPSNRPKDNFMPKFRDAFMLYYSDDERKGRELTDLRKMFARKHMADYWFGKHSELVR